MNQPEPEERRTRWDSTWIAPATQPGLTAVHAEAIRHMKAKLRAVADEEISEQWNRAEAAVRRAVTEYDKRQELEQQNVRLRAELEQARGASVARAAAQIRTDAGLRDAEGATDLGEYGRELADLIAPEEGEQEPETNEQREDRRETERAHVRGEHQYCGVTCEAVFPTEMLRNGILAKGYPGTAGMLDELLRRAAGTDQPAAEHHREDQ